MKNPYLPPPKRLLGSEIDGYVEEHGVNRRKAQYNLKNQLLAKKHEAIASGKDVNDHKRFNYYLLRVNGKVIPTVIHIGGNGYFGTAFICSRLQLEKLDLSNVQETPCGGSAGDSDIPVAGELSDSKNDITVESFWAAIKVNGDYIDADTLAQVNPDEVVELLDQLEEHYRLYETDPELVLTQADRILQDLRCLRLAYLLCKLTRRRVRVFSSTTISGTSVDTNTAALRARQVELLKGLAAEIMQVGDTATYFCVLLL